MGDRVTVGLYGRACAVLMREAICERIFRARDRWNADHPCRALGVREIPWETITWHVSRVGADAIVDMDKTAIRALAASIMDEVDAIVDEAAR